MYFGHLKLYIDVKVDANEDKRHYVICPATEKKVAEIAWAGAEDALLTIDSTQKGFLFWSRRSLTEKQNGF